ncbi:hypothetical protein [Nocardia sp. R7R-8]|uniref:hypothetical protein n=1 Tax=Nocardia sp. R7R-8 TaxID=3459304 RepID=UPI00403DD2A4
MRNWNGFAAISEPPVAPIDYLLDGVVNYLASLTARDLAALLAQVRPPNPPGAESTPAGREVA